jgi:hypothetical protein
MAICNGAWPTSTYTERRNKEIEQKEQERKAREQERKAREQEKRRKAESDRIANQPSQVQQVQQILSRYVPQFSFR